MQKTLRFSGLPGVTCPDALEESLTSAGCDVERVVPCAFRAGGSDCMTPQGGAFDVIFAAGSKIPDDLNIFGFESKIRITRATSFLKPAPAPELGADMMPPPTPCPSIASRAPAAQVGRSAPGKALPPPAGQAPRPPHPQPAAAKPAAGGRGKKRPKSEAPQADAAHAVAIQRQHQAARIKSGAERAALADAAAAASAAAAAKAAAEREQQYPNCSFCNSPDHKSDACAERSAETWASKDVAAAATAAAAAAAAARDDMEMGEITAAVPHAGGQGPPAAVTASRTDDGPRA
jgi:hypothetical protein